MDITGHMKAILTDLVWAWLVIWLFNTTAGQTFLAGRSGQPLETARSLYWVSLVYHAAAFFVGGATAGIVAENTNASSAASWASLLNVGLITLILILLYTVMAVAAHLLYWYWSVASLVAFATFSITSVVLGVIIAWLAYVHDIKDL